MVVQIARNLNRWLLRFLYLLVVVSCAGEATSAAVAELIGRREKLADDTLNQPQGCASAASDSSMRVAPDIARSLVVRCVADGFALFLLTSVTGARYLVSEYPSSIIAWEPAFGTAVILNVPRLRRGPTRAQVSEAKLTTVVSHQSILAGTTVLSNGLIAIVYRDTDKDAVRMFLTLLDFQGHRICVDELIARTDDPETMALFHVDTLLVQHSRQGSAKTQRFAINASRCPFNGIQFRNIDSSSAP